jgi:hypothetical protein
MVLAVNNSAILPLSRKYYRCLESADYQKVLFPRPNAEDFMALPARINQM